MTKNEFVLMADCRLHRGTWDIFNGMGLFAWVLQIEGTFYGGVMAMIPEEGNDLNSFLLKERILY